MTTFAQASGAAAARWAVWVTIEGVADVNGQVRFCYEVPGFAGSETWKELLAQDSDIALLSEAPSLDGGFADAGSLTFELVDVGDYLTDTLRTESSPATTLTADCTASATSVSVPTAYTAAAPAAPYLLWVGSECLKVTAVGSGSLTVTRGFGGTAALPHTSGDKLYRYIPFLTNRAAVVKIAPKDAASETEARELGQYALDGLDFDEGLNKYIFSARSQLIFYSRTAPNGDVREGTVQIIQPETSTLPQQLWLDNFRLWQWQYDDRFGNWGEANIHLRVGDEVIEARTSSRVAFVERRGLAGTDSKEFELGQRAVQVFVAGEDDFRWSASGSTSRASGWTASSNWIDIILNILTSASKGGTELTNTATEGNWSHLPAGYGLGIPTSLIDVSALLALRSRTIDYVFPNFVYGDDPRPFSELITDWFLEPMGAYFITSGGKARIVLPRIPAADETVSYALGPEKILSMESGGRVRLPEISFGRRLGDFAQKVVLEVGPTKQRTEINNQQAELFLGHYAHELRGKTVQVKGAREADAGLFERRWAEYLYLNHRPVSVAEGKIDLSLWDWQPGDIGSISLDEVPNADGTRGLNNRLAIMLERQAAVPLADPANIQAKWQFYGDLKVGKIAPAARVTGWNAGTKTLTVAANEYTETDADGGLPTADASAFAKGQKVRLINADGTPVSGVNKADTEEVVDVSGNTIEVTGDWGITPASGDILTFAVHDESDSGQIAGWVYYADKDDHTVGASSEAPWTYGQT